MYLNGYSVRIPEGDERAHGYVHMRHGQVYSLVLGNKSSCRCNVNVAIDGKDVGTWRMERGQTLTLERPVNEQKLFTFYKASSVQGIAVGGGITPTEQGLLQVTFIPEDTTQPARVLRSAHPMKSHSSWHGGGMISSCNVQSRSLSAGVTGLSGHSNQTFGVADHMRLDLRAQQIINLRMVCVEEYALNDPTPLRPVTAESTPVPPPVR